MFAVPEGRKLFLWTKASRALEKAILFMTPADWEILSAADAAYNQKADELWDEKVATGWKPSRDKDVLEKELRQMEDAASSWVEQNVPGYLAAFNKLDALFGSALDDDASSHG